MDDNYKPTRERKNNERIKFPTENGVSGCQTAINTSRQTSASSVCWQARLPQSVNNAIRHLDKPPPKGMSTSRVAGKPEQEESAAAEEEEGGRR